MLKSVNDALAEIRKLSANYTYDNATDIDDAQPNYCQQWADVIGETLTMGALVVKNGTKYHVMQTHTAQEIYPPDGEGVLSLYQAYRGAQSQVWVYGEYSEVGYIRIDPDTGLEYVAIQDPVANIYAPSEVPSVWEVVTSDDL